MIKSFSRGKFAALSFYSGKLYRGDLRLHVNIFSTVGFRVYAIIFPGDTWRTFRASGIFCFKKLLTSRTKKKNITWMVHFEFLKFPNQVNKGVNPHLNLPCQKNTNVCSNYLVCKQTRSQRVILLVLLERKGLNEKQNSLLTGASWLAVLPWAAKKTR